MKVVLGGIAYGALKDSHFPEDHPELWQRIQTYSISLAQGRGISVHLNLCAEDLQVLRNCFCELNRRLHAIPYPVRGQQGNIAMQSIGIALGRLDDALRDHVEL